MPIDTTRTITYAGSPWKLMALVLAGVALVGASAFLLTIETYKGSSHVPLFVRVFGAIGVVFFGLTLLIAIARLLKSGRAVVTLAPQGLRDIRVAPDFVPWHAIERIATWERLGNAVMVVSVRPDVEKALRLTPIARWTRGANTSLGADGLCVAHTGLDTGYATLLATTVAYWETYRNRPA